MREHPQPGKRIFTFVELDALAGNRWPTDAMKAVATGNVLAAQLMVCAGMIAERDRRRAAVEIVYRYVGSLEPDLSAVRQRSRDEVLHHFLLTVNRDRLAGELHEIDVVIHAVEA